MRIATYAARTVMALAATVALTTAQADMKNACSHNGHTVKNACSHNGHTNTGRSGKKGGMQ